MNPIHLLVVLAAGLFTMTSSEPSNPLKSKYDYAEHLTLTTTSTLSDSASPSAYSSSHYRNAKVMANYEFILAMIPTAEALSSSSNALLDLLATRSEYQPLQELHLVFTTGRNILRNKLGNGVMLRTLQSGPFPWKKLVNDLSGVFCASLNLLDTTTLASPKWTFAPSRGGHNSSDFQVKYAVLPKESQCTENLTPWLKLLPCRNRAGLAAMLDPYKLYDSDYVEMGVHMYKDCSQTMGPICAVRFVQSLEFIVDPQRMMGSKDWKLSGFQRTQDIQVCPLTTSHSEIVLKVEKTTAFTWNVVPHATNDQGAAIYTLKDLILWKDVLGTLGVSFNKDLLPPKGALVQSHHASFSVDRYSTGYGQEYGGISLNLVNRDDKDIQVIVFQMIPWYLEVYLSSLEITGHPLVHDLDDIEHPKGVDLRNALKDMYYQPSIPRTRPSVLEALVTVPRKTRLEIRLQFDKGFIKYTEHPPDANRGFDIGPAIITLPHAHGPQLFYTSNLLINLPTPDFSMPYNVITLTCTALALLVGSIFNLMIRDVKPIGE